jgi:hypothetical protein
MTTTIQEFNYSVDLLQALLWQYNDAVNLQGLLASKQAWYTENQTEFWTNWYTDVFDLRTANDFGLAVWAIILGQSLYVNLSSAGRPTWGFEEFHRNFNRGNFASGAGSTVRLTTETSRILLRLRAYQLQTAACVPEINRMLADVFAGFVAPGDTPAYVQDNLDMTCNYIFLFDLPTELSFALRYFDVLPRPAGVESDF